jgi:hypothetical protein
VPRRLREPVETRYKRGDENGSGRRGTDTVFVEIPFVIILSFIKILATDVFDKRFFYIWSFFNVYMAVLNDS